MNINTFTQPELTIISSLLNTNQNVMRMVLSQMIQEKIKNLISTGSQSEIHDYVSINAKLDMLGQNTFTSGAPVFDPVSFHVTVDDHTTSMK